MTTVTTVGHGDICATTTESKARAMVLMVVGIGYFAVLTGALADQFVKISHREEIETLETEETARPDDLAAHIDQLALRAHDLATELEALRLAVPPNVSRPDQRHG